MVQVYEEPLSRRHYAPVLSATNAIRYITVLGAIAAAVATSYGSGGFWAKEITLRTQPRVKFMHEMVILLERERAGDELFWSTFEHINNAMEDKYAPMTVEVVEEDYNFDGIVDLVDIKATAPSALNVKSAKGLFQFLYVIDENHAKLSMQTLAYASASSPLAGAGVYVDGLLKLRQKSKFREGRHRQYYNYAPLPEGRAGGALLAQDTLRFESILDAYNMRNETTILDDAQYVWQAGSVSGFEFHARIRIPPEEEVRYEPNIWYILKMGWIQFLSIFIIFWYIMKRAEYIAFHYRILHTRLVSDLAPKVHKF